MSREKLVKNLGTFAKSGTSDFLAKMQDSSSTQDLSDLLGQFGVGFYSSFLVADRVIVLSKSTDDEQHIWESDAAQFSVVQDPRGNSLKRGTQFWTNLIFVVSTDVYSLCVAHPDPFTNQLYNETKEFLTRHVQSLRDQIVQYENNSDLLKVYHEMWIRIKYSMGVSYLNKLYTYLNQQHVKKSKLSEADLTCGSIGDLPGHMVEIGKLGLEIWRLEMLEKIKDNLIELVLEAIRINRRGDSAVPTTVVNGVIQSFVAVEDPELRVPGDPSTHLTFYEKCFEEPFLQDTGQYYQKEANKLTETCTVAEYMEKVIQKLHEEDMRARRYLHPTSYAKLSAKCHKRLVTDNASLLHAECLQMVENDRRKDLAHMYCLLKPLPGGLSVLADTLEHHIQNEGLDAVKSMKPETAHVDFVEKIVVVQKKYKEIVSNVFNSDQQFLSALDKACTKVINWKGQPATPGQAKLPPCKSPELLAKYCDTLLKKSTKGFSDQEVDEKLNNSIMIFKYIEDKDVFQKFYARNLARRLVHQLTNSMDAEEGMINRLKSACGYEFTNKLHRMFTDVSVSNDLCNKFNDYLSSQNLTTGVGFSVQVLQAGAWPLQSNYPVQVPQVLEKSMQHILGVIEDTANKSRLAKFLRFQSSNGSGLTSLANYVSRMKDKQESIFYIAGASRDEVEKSAFVERLLKKGYEVLYLTEAVDEYMIGALPEFEGKKFQKLAKEGLSLAEGKKAQEKLEKTKKIFEPLTKWLTENALKEQVSKAIVSERLQNSPCALVAGMYGWAGNMERMALSNPHQKADDISKTYYLNQKKTLEINPRHPLIKELLRRVNDDGADETAKEIALMMFRTATLRSGYMLKDTVDFAQNVESKMRQTLGIPADEEVEEDDLDAGGEDAAAEDADEDASDDSNAEDDDTQSVGGDSVDTDHDEL